MFSTESVQCIQSAIQQQYDYDLLRRIESMGDFFNSLQEQKKAIIPNLNAVFARSMVEIFHLTADERIYVNAVKIERMSKQVSFLLKNEMCRPDYFKRTFSSGVSALIEEFELANHDTRGNKIKTAFSYLGVVETPEIVRFRPGSNFYMSSKGSSFLEAVGLSFQQINSLSDKREKLESLDDKLTISDMKPICEALGIPQPKN